MTRVNSINANLIIASGSDAELLELGRLFDAICLAIKDAEQRSHELSDLLDARLPAKPDALRFRRGDPALSEFDGPRACGQGYYLPAVVEKLRTVGESRAAEIVAAHDGWMRTRDAIDRQIGSDAATEICDRLLSQRFKIEAAIREFPATTLEGWRVKARLALQIWREDAGGTDREDAEWPSPLAWSIIE